MLFRSSSLQSDSTDEFYNKYYGIPREGLVDDSLRYNRLTNTFGLSNINQLDNKISNDKLINYTGHISLDYFQLLQNGADSVVHDTSGLNLLVGGSLNVPFFEDFKLRTRFDYNLLGTNKGNYIGNLILESNLSDSPNYFWKASLDISNTDPFIFYDWNNSSQFQWRNNFQRNRNVSSNFLLKSNRLLGDIKIKLNMYGNYIYLNKVSRPEQYNGTIGIFQIGINKYFNLGKKWNFEVNLSSMYSSIDSIISVPTINGMSSFYFDSFVFNKALRMQTGVDITYFTPFFAMGYMPLYGQRHIQSYQLVGGYPFIDLYVAARIKHAKVFIKASHVNSDLTGFNYYLLPDMPVRGRTIQLGVKWNFYH